MNSRLCLTPQASGTCNCTSLIVPSSARLETYGMLLGPRLLFFLVIPLDVAAAVWVSSAWANWPITGYSTPHICAEGIGWCSQADHTHWPCPLTFDPVGWPNLIVRCHYTSCNYVMLWNTHTDAYKHLNVVDVRTTSWGMHPARVAHTQTAAMTMPSPFYLYVAADSQAGKDKVVTHLL